MRDRRQRGSQGNSGNGAGQGQSSARTTLSPFTALLGVLDGAQAMESLTGADLMRFVVTRRAEVSNAPVNRQLQALCRTLRQLAKAFGATMPGIDLKAPETGESEEPARELT
ncbi:MAG: hypothetical protein JJU15_13390 [Pararhodobacter sp.]|nr:hypothetical protein [Pararhodobacter sp.]